MEIAQPLRPGTEALTEAANTFSENRDSEKIEEVDTMSTLAPLVETIVGLAELREINDLKSPFNQDRGSPRLILLLSPT